MVYQIGDLVLVDKWNKAFVVQIHKPGINNVLKDYYFTVRYLVTNHIQTNIPLHRIRPAILHHQRRERTSAHDDTASTAMDASTTARASSSTHSSTATLKTKFKELQQAMKETHGLVMKQPTKKKKKKKPSNTTTTNISTTTNVSNTTNDSTTNDSNTSQQNPLYNFLVNNNNNHEKGWLRQVIQNDTKTIKKNTRLTQKERQVLLMISSLFSGFNFRFGAQLARHNQIVDYAFFISDRTTKSLFNKFIDDKFEITTKVRSDKNKTVFNSISVRKRTFTPFNVFKKDYNIKNITVFANERLSHDELKQKYEGLDDETKKKYEIEASVRHQRSSFLWDELKKLLLDTKGTLSYVAMSAQLNDIVCADTIRRFLLTKEGYHIRKSRLIPHLTKGNIAKRKEWAETYWVFWKAVKTINNETTQYVMVHMDEKWFYAVKTRSNCKVLTSIGLEPTNHHVQHRSHVDKLMFICVTAYVLNDNDIERGGKCITVAMIPVAVEQEAARTTYKRNYYGVDGKFNYQNKDEAHLSRVKGQKYLKATELTGCSTKPKKIGSLPRISLYDEYKNKIIPALEEKVVNMYNKNSDGMRRNVVIVLQEDNAGPHNSKKYNRQMDILFEEKGWVRFNQPPQSPVTNVHDAAIFPMLSKLVSRIQAVMFGGRLLVGDELRTAVDKAYFDKNNLVAMSRAFAANHQIVSAILHYKGDNGYLKEKGGLTFGIRKTFIVNKEGDGVIPVDLAPANESETFCGRLIQVGLKYKAPNIYDLKDVTLSRQMKIVLNKDVELDSLCEYDKDFWENILDP